MRRILLVAGLVLAMGGSAQARPLPDSVQRQADGAGLTIAFQKGSYVSVEVPDRCPRPRPGVYRCTVTAKYWTAPRTPAYCDVKVLAGRRDWGLFRNACPWP